MTTDVVNTRPEGAIGSVGALWRLPRRWKKQSASLLFPPALGKVKNNFSTVTTAPTAVNSTNPTRYTFGRRPSFFIAQPKNLSYIAFDNATAAEMTDLLRKLSDDLVRGNLAHQEVNSANYWRTWQRSFETLRESVLNVAKNITLHVKTTFFDTEIKF